MANPDFIAIPWAVFTDARLTWQAKALYGRLKLYAGRDGACWPSQSTLAREMQMSDRNVRRTIMELSLVGWISIVRRRTTARYLIHATPVINAVSDRTDLSGEIGQICPVKSGQICPVHIKESSSRDPVKENTIRRARVPKQRPSSMSLVDDDDENQRRPEEYLRSLYERKTGAHIPAAVERRVWEAVELRGVSRADFVISLRPHADNAWRNPAGFLTAFARRCGVPTVDVPVASPEPPRNAHGRCARCNGVGKLDGEWCSCALGRDFRGLELRALGRKQIESESAMSEVKYCGQSVQ